MNQDEKDYIEVNIDNWIESHYLWEKYKRYFPEDWSKRFNHEKYFLYYMLKSLENCNGVKDEE